MTLKDRRLARGWTQEHLAQASGLSVRTVQRLERGEVAGPDSQQALAVAFGVEVADLINPPAPSQAEQDWAQHRQIFRAHWVTAAITLPALLVFANVVTPQEGGWLGAGSWMGFVLAGWGLGLALHAALVFLVYRPKLSGR